MTGDARRGEEERREEGRVGGEVKTGDTKMPPLSWERADVKFAGGRRASGSRSHLLFVI
jgi:hypothetical protein